MLCCPKTFEQYESSFVCGKPNTTYGWSFSFSAFGQPLLFNLERPHQRVKSIHNVTVPSPYVMPYTSTLKQTAVVCMKASCLTNRQISNKENISLGTESNINLAWCKTGNILQSSWRLVDHPRWRMTTSVKQSKCFRLHMQRMLQTSSASSSPISVVIPSEKPLNKLAYSHTLVNRSPCVTPQRGVLVWCVQQVSGQWGMSLD